MAEPFTVEHFEDWCSTLTLDNDESFRLEGFQRAFVADLFAGRPVNWFIVPEASGKTMNGQLSGWCSSATYASTSAGSAGNATAAVSEPPTEKRNAGQNSSSATHELASVSTESSTDGWNSLR